MEFSIRKLDEADWQLFADMRLLSLSNDPGVFGSTFDVESGQKEHEWRSTVSDRDSAIFAIFSNDIPIGIAAISTYRQDPGGRTAILWGSWIKPDFRRMGLSKLVYQARLEWARQQGSYDRVLVSHRASNLVSKKANQKFGFVFTGKTEREWPDGARAAEYHYELLL